ncbi:MAG: MraY family glycosyltransferase [Pirellula sp.]|jgi:UDP-GlcNAc:undecaprenyl-phosphate GlcNAc-1-phosphate transferase|nr:undecaprenyl/decaprenyl-phosphate alpha-N-acetylglucosaminyl 1-phosphate transferase [Pirellula sp.]
MTNDLFIAVCVLAVTAVPSFLISLFVVGWVRKNALQLGLMDQPSERKVHTTPIPRGGGIGIASGVLMTFAIGALFTWISNGERSLIGSVLPESIRSYLPGLLSRLPQFAVLVGGGIALAGLGLLDDRFGLPWQPRLLIEFVVAGAVVYGQNLQFTAFIQLPWLTSILSVLWIVLLINSFNMLDNMDGLSAGVATIVCGMLSLMLLMTSEESRGQPQLFVAAMLLVLFGGLIGFLRYNWPPASIFMGDAGSYFVGYWIAVSTLLATYVDARGTTPHSVLAPLCLLAIPIYDTVSVVFVRLREGRSPFQADKRHFSHRLVDMGLSKEQAVVAIHLATLTCSIGALLLPRTDLVGAVLVIAIVVCMLGLVSVIEGLLRKTIPKPIEPGFPEKESTK